LRSQRAAQLTLTAREHAEALAGFGDDATPGSSVALRSGLLEGPHLAMQLGARVDPRPDPERSGSVLRLDDSAVVLGAAGVQLEAWSHRNWWGPGWQSALALGNNAPALAGVGLQRSSGGTAASPWFSWLGPWSAEAFVARSDGKTLPSYPFIFGGRFEFRPFSHLEIGFERTTQWGGGGRNQSIGSFLNMVLSRHSNPANAAQQAYDPANGMAGYDARIRCPDFLRCAVYGQAIGEDMAGKLPSRFLGLGGVEAWSADGSQRFVAEAARTSIYKDWFGKPILSNAYRNYAYPDGYTDDGRWLGAGVGPDSRLFSFGWIDADADSLVRVAVGHVGSRIGVFSPDTFDPRESGRLLAVSARRSFEWGPATWTPQLDWSRVRAPAGTQRETRLGLEMRMNLDDVARGPAGAWAGARLGDADPHLVASVAALGAAFLLDRAADRFARTHLHDTADIGLRRVGDALPYAEFGLAAVSWLALDDPRAARTGLAGVEAALASVVAAEAIKRVVDRPRPTEGRGAGSFGDADSRAHSAFPSEHSALAWALLTPAAEEYDAPWLYGVAGLTNAGRVFGRAHWLSDTAAGAVLGWWIGDAFRARNAAAAGAPRVAIGPRSIGLVLPLR
jgi:membrane-associated phospholipid phosphatase